MGETMLTTSKQSKKIKEITQNLDRIDTVFCMQIDSYIRQFDLFRSEFIEIQYIILTDLYSKLEDKESAWEVYENPRTYCDSIISKYNRKYIGFVGVIVRRILPLYLEMILFLLLIISPNGFSRILYLDNPGIEMPLNSLLGILLILFIYFLMAYFEFKLLFNKKQKNLSFYFKVIIQIFIYIIIVNNKVLFKNLVQINIVLNPMIMAILLGLLIIYFVYNLKKMIF